MTEKSCVFCLLSLFFCLNVSPPFEAVRLRGGSHPNDIILLGHDVVPAAAFFSASVFSANSNSSRVTSASGSSKRQKRAQCSMRSASSVKGLVMPGRIWVSQTHLHIAPLYPRSLSCPRLSSQGAPNANTPGATSVSQRTWQEDRGNAFTYLAAPDNSFFSFRWPGNYPVTGPAPEQLASGAARHGA
eukprot:COSAG06_NODE_1602_length_8958_cov_85.920194_13_plen_187_part_00